MKFPKLQKYIQLSAVYSLNSFDYIDEVYKNLSKTLIQLEFQALLLR